ncbi:MAG: hypothetical protein FWD94_08890 [Treponema sp.]|nr:hypothetical protein [Treponema sp.]
MVGENGTATGTATAERDGGEELAMSVEAGISEEERREILVQIDGIAERNRQSLSSATETGTGTRFTADRSGGLFPVMVILCSLAALAGGFFALSAFQNEVDVQAREGSRVFNTTERALIAEIRRETSRLLAAKDLEISSMTLMLSDIEAELQGMTGNQTLTDEQRERQARLLALREEYTEQLTELRDDRTRIIDDARSQETVLQDNLDVRAREIAAGVPISDTEPEAVRNEPAENTELAELAAERAQVQAVEAQVEAFFGTIRSQVSTGLLGDARDSISGLRGFLENGNFRSVRQVQGRMGLYLNALDTYEALLKENSMLGAALLAGRLPPDTTEVDRLRTEVDRLSDTSSFERTIAALQGERDALSTRADGLQRDLTAERGRTGTLQGQLNTARARVDALEQEQRDIASLNQRITGLQDENAQLLSRLNQAQQTVRELEQAWESLQQFMLNQQRAQD